MRAMDSRHDFTLEKYSGVILVHLTKKLTRPYLNFFIQNRVLLSPLWEGKSPFFQRFTMIDHPYEIVRIRMISKATTEIFRSHFVALRRCFGLRSANTRRKSLSDGTAPAAPPHPLPLRPRPCPRSDPTPLPAAAFVCTLRVGTAECRL